MDRVCAGRVTGAGRAAGALLFALLAGLWIAPATAQSSTSDSSAQAGKQQAQSGAKKQSDAGSQGDDNAFPEARSRQAAQQAKDADKRSGSQTPSSGTPASGSSGSDSTPVPDAPAASKPPATPDASATPDDSATPDKAAEPDSAGTPANSAGDQQTKPPSAAQDNPFPEDVSREAAKSAAASGSGSGVSSSSSYDPGVDRDNGDRETPAGRRKLPKPSDDVEVGSLSATARAKKDVEVGNYYLSAGGDQGAYARFADANKMDPTNIDAIFGLAEAARHLQRTQEAVANYKLFLDIEPDGSRAKLARKALNGLNAKK
jgi:tetratricopeptide (TPR) repeat protein